MMSISISVPLCVHIVYSRRNEDSNFVLKLGPDYLSGFEIGLQFSELQ